MRYRLGLFLFTLGLAGNATAGDWPQWRGLHRDGKSTDTGLLKTWPAGGPKLLWKVESVATIGDGYGSLAIVGDKAYLLGASGTKQGDQEFLTCLNTRDGSKVWQTKFNTTEGSYLDRWGGGPRSTPTVDGDRVYVLGSTGDLACLATADGKLLWSTNLVKDFGGAIPKWGYSESPLVDGDHLVCTPGSSGGMLALNKATGAKVWQCKEIGDEAGYSSILPIDVGGVRQYVQQTMEHGIGVRADGKLLWKVGEIKRRTAVIPSPVVYKDFVFFTAGYGAGCELYKLTPDGKDGTKADKVYSNNRVVANHHGGVIQLGEELYGHSDTSGWVCFDLLKGGEDALWSSSKLGKGSIAYADGAFYCYAEKNGELVKIAASPEGWKELGRFTIPKTSKERPQSGKVWPHPVIANGKLFLRDYENLYCYDLSQATN